MAELHELQEPQDEQPRFLHDEPVHDHMPDGSRYGDDRWDYQPISPPSFGSRWVTFTKLPPGYRDDVRTLLMLQGRPAHPAAVEAGIVLRRNPATASRIFDDYYRLLVITSWGDAHQLNHFGDWTDSHAADFITDLFAGDHRPNGRPLDATTVRGYITLLKLIGDTGPLMHRPLTFAPWPRQSAMEVAGEIRQIENKTKPLPWEVWAPLMAAISTVINVCGPTIIRADRLLRESRLTKELSSGPSGEKGYERISEYLADGGRIPLHTGFGRTGGGQRGTINKALTFRAAGVSKNLLSRTHRSYSAAAAIAVSEAVDAGQTILGGLIDPTERPEDHWIGELGLAEAEYLPSVLRGACYVMISTLSGMRDSELQSLERGALTLDGGIPSLTGRTYKRVEPGGRIRPWWVPSVAAEAIDALTALASTDRLFTRTTRRGWGTDDGSFDSARDIRRLIHFINAAPDERPGRGSHLGFRPVQLPAGQRINATTLRRSFAVYAATKPGADIGIGIQLGQAALRVTTGYMSDSTHAATKTLTDERAAVVRNELGRLLSSETAIAGAAAPRIEQLRAQVISDPARADQVIARAAANYHLGIVNDCNFRAETAACGEDGPHLASHFCVNHDCANAVIHEAHLTAIDGQIARLDRHLDNYRTPAFEAQIRRQRAGLVSLRAIVQAKAELE